MSVLTLETRPRAKQTAYNLSRWDEVLADPELRKLPGRVETDRHGRVVINSTPVPRHGKLQNAVGSELRRLMPSGHTITECPVSTADGVKGADVAWASPERWAELGNRACFIRSPEICVEVISPSNSEEEIREKIALYLDAGAQEVWGCSSFGAMTFFGPGGTILPRSELCPNFPAQLPL